MAVMRSLLAALVVGLCAAGTPDPTTVEKKTSVTTVTAKITFQGPSGAAAKFQAASPQVEKIVTEAMGKPATCTKLCVQQSLRIPSERCTSACKPATTTTTSTTARAATTLSNSLYSYTFTSKDAVSDYSDRLSERKADMLSVLGAGWSVQSVFTFKSTTSSKTKTKTKKTTSGTTSSKNATSSTTSSKNTTSTTTGPNLKEGAPGAAPSLSALALVGCLAAVLVA